MTTENTTEKTELTVEELKAEVARLKPFEDQYKGLQTKHNKVVMRNKELAGSSEQTNLSTIAAIKRLENMHLATTRLLGKQFGDETISKLADETVQRAKVDEYNASFRGEFNALLEEHDANLSDPDLEDALKAYNRGKGEEAMAIARLKLDERKKGEGKTTGAKTVEELVAEQVEARMRQLTKVDTAGSTAGGTKKATGDALIEKAGRGEDISIDEQKELAELLGLKIRFK